MVTVKNDGLKELFKVDKLNIPKDWEDTSYGNDAMYSFEINDLRIWIDREEKEFSEVHDDEYGEYERFHVIYSDAYMECHLEDDLTSVLLSTMDFNKIITFVEENKGKAFEEFEVDRTQTVYSQTTVKAHTIEQAMELIESGNCYWSESSRDEVLYPNI